MTQVTVKNGNLDMALRKLRETVSLLSAKKENVMINQVYVEEQLKKRALRTQEKEIKLTEIETN
jgi:ribosomal protein S21